MAEAERCYRRAVDLLPEEPVAVFDLGVALQDQERFAEAAAAYKAPSPSTTPSPTLTSTWPPSMKPSASARPPSAISRPTRR